MRFPPRPIPRSLLALLVCTLPVVATGSHAAPDGLSRLENAVVKRIDANREAAVALLGRAVDIPSATENLEGVRRTADLFAAELRSLGFTTRWVPLPAEMGRAGHLVAERRGTRGKKLLLIGHLDTVLQGEPFRREGDKAFGSGVSDMKGGDVILLEALRALHQEGALEGRTVVVVLTGDEEATGRPHAVSRAALVDAAKASDVALAFEGYATGMAVVGRRGVASWRLEVEGSQGHSSAVLGPLRGSGAIFEAARILAAFHDQLREPNLTYNPSVIVGGTDVELDAATKSGTAAGKHNVVARRAIVEGDLRFLSADQLERAQARMREIVSKSWPKTSATIAFFPGMPSMTPTDGNRALLKALDGASRDLGTGPMSEHDPNERGAGDISFVAHLVDSLDGLGAYGEREHAPGEWIDLAQMPALTKRAALLIYRLTR